MSFLRAKRRGLLILFGIGACALVVALFITSSSVSSPKPALSENDHSSLNEGSQETMNERHGSRHRAFEARLLANVNKTKEVQSSKQHASHKTLGREPVGIILGKNYASAWDRKHRERAQSLQKEVIKNNAIFDNQLSHKLVHLDLKGAPPKISYLRILIPYMKEMGATGLLIEYEDSFPYWGPLASLAARNAYTRKEISEILAIARGLHMEVIPIIQSIGHMESLLKLKEFQDMREVPNYPQVICPTNNRTIPLIKSIIDQITELHPGLNWLHIGADEVFNMGECMRCQAFMVANDYGKSEMFLYHIGKIAKYVKDVYDIQPIIWDDEIRKAAASTIKKSGIKEYVEIMVWKYDPGIMADLRMDVWEKYIESFAGVWIASAFKGASSPDSFITNISERLNNHKEWMELVDMYKSVIPFRGITLTGWQRFDHFSVLCELLPQAIPSLAVNLMYVTQRQADHTALSKVGQALNCNSYLNLDLKYLDFVNKCNFPGSNFYEIAQRLHILHKDVAKMYANPHVKGWVSEYNIQHNFASPQHVEQGLQDLAMLLFEVRKLKVDAEKVLAEVYDEYTVHEWIEQNLLKLLNELSTLHKTCLRLLSITHWPRRPLEVSHEKEL